MYKKLITAICKKIFAHTNHVFNFFFAEKAYKNPKSKVKLLLIIICDLTSKTNRLDELIRIQCA